MRLLASLLLLAAALLAAPAGPALAQSAVKIVVNGAAITDYDIAQRTKLLEISGQTGGVAKAKEDLIDEAVQLTELARRGGSVNPAQVESAFGNIAGGMKKTPDELGVLLNQAGIAPQTLKNRLKAQIGWNMLVQYRLSQEAKKNAKDVTAVLESGKEKDAALVREYVLQQIIFITPKGASNEIIAQRRREAEAFRGRFKGCEASVEQAKALRDVVVKDIGRRDTTQISQQLVATLKDVAVGRTSAPNNGDQGIELIAICSVRDTQSNEAARDRIETKLALAQGETIGAEYLKQLRSKALIQYR